jgi:very-short-patch-repair endonuclease
MRIRSFHRRIWGRTDGGVGFIVDFYCHKARLFLEVDGDIHDLQQEEDARREKALREMGLWVVRFGNEEVERVLFAVVGNTREVIAYFLFTSSNRGKIQL